MTATSTKPRKRDYAPEQATYILAKDRLESLQEERDAILVSGGWNDDPDAPDHVTEAYLIAFNRTEDLLDIPAARAILDDARKALIRWGTQLMDASQYNAAIADIYAQARSVPFAARFALFDGKQVLACL